MPYTLKTDAELKRTINNIKAGNASGDGLHNEENQVKMYALSQMLKRAADSLNPKENDKEMRELKMELEAVAKSLDNLRNPKILLKDDELDNIIINDDDNKVGDFEDAIRDVTNFHDLLMKRTKSGRSYFEIIEHLGKDDSYKREDFLNTLKEINRHVNCGYDNIDEEIKYELTPKAKAEYLKKREVIDFKNDPKAVYVASLLDTGSKNYKQLEDMVYYVSSPGQWDDADDYLKYSYGKNLMNLIAEINSTTQASRKRELMLQAYTTFDCLYNLAKEEKYKNAEFITNCENLDPIQKELGSNTLNVLFNENDEMVVKQFKSRKQPKLMELPKDVSYEMAVAFFAQGKVMDNNLRNPDTVSRYFMDNVLTKGLEYLNESKSVSKEFKEAIKPLYNAAKQFSYNLNQFELLSRYKEEKGYIKTDDQSKNLGILSENLKDVIDASNDFINKYSETNPEFVDLYLSKCGPLISAFKDFNFKSTLNNYKTEVLKQPEGVPVHPDYELYNDDSKAINSKLYINSTKAWYNTAYLGINIGKNIIDPKNINAFKNTQTAIYNQATRYARLDTNDNSKMDFTLGVSEATSMALLRNKLNGVTPSATSDPEMLGKNLIELRNLSLAKVNENPEHHSNTYRKMWLKVYNLANKYYLDGLNKGDKFANYVSSQAGFTGTGGADTVNVNVVAAYLWQHEQLKKNPNKTPKFSQAEIEKKARQLKESPIYKAYFVPNDAEIKEAKKKHEAYIKKYNYDINERPFDKDEFLESYKKQKESMFSNTALIPMAVANFEKPFMQGVSPAEQKRALKQLAELGQIMDRCSFWSSKQYKAFYYGLKDLAKKDIDNMPSEEMGELLKDLYDKTVNFMNGRMGVRKKPEQREHFEQTLDALEIFSHLGKNGDKLVKNMLHSVNVIRQSHGQAEVSLEGRTTENTRIRLKKLRGELKDRRIVTGIDLLDEQFTKKGHFRAGEVNEETKLPKAPKNAGKLIDLNTEIQAINAKLGEKGNGYVIANECVPKLLALNYIAAYKGADNKAVISEKEYKRAVEIISRHRGAQELVVEYEKAGKIQELLESDNKIQLLSDKFKDKNATIKSEYEALDNKKLGGVAGISDEMIEHRIKERYQKNVVNKILKENPLKNVDSLDELDRQLERMDAENLNKNDEVLFEQYNIDAGEQADKAIQIVEQKRKDYKIEQEIKKNNEANKARNTEFKKN